MKNIYKRRPDKRKIIRRFNLSVFILFLAIFQVSAGSYAQLITLNEKNASMEKVFRSIKQQTGYVFVYDNNDFKSSRIDIHIKNSTISEAMNECLKDLPFTYKVVKNNILVKRDEGAGLKEIQQKIISGKVVDANGAPLTGVTVRLKGSTLGTTTNASGNYSLEIPGTEGVLQFSFIGFTPQEMTIGSNTTVNATLMVGNSSLTDVVVVGYGTQQRREITGAISSVKASDLENMPVNRVEQSLQGRTSGLTITTSSGQPGSGAVVRVRGTTSINNSDPLYIVDGVQIGGGIDYLNQADIASIEVLKDAASAAIYGARAANGVILITTKTGTRTGKINANYNAYAGLQSPARKLSLLNATEYATLLNEATVAGGGLIRFPNPSQYGVGTDWQDAVFKNNAPIQNHELSLSGGNEVSTYFGSFGYLDQEGIVASSNSKYKRFTMRFNSNHNITKAIRFGNNIGYTRTNSVGIGTNDEWGSPLNRAINIDPITPLIVTDPAVINSAPYNNQPVVRDRNGNPYGISNLVTSEILNPIAALAVAQGNGWSDKIVGNVFVEVEPIEGLKIRSNGGVDLAFWGNESFSPVFYLNSINQNTLNGYTRNMNRGLFWSIENTVSYDKVVDKHHVNGLVGISAQKNKGETNGGTKRGIPVDNIKEASLAFPVPQTNQFFSGGEYLNTLNSLFARVNYSFDEKYLLTAIIRRDGSSRFGPNNKYGYFPSASLGWIASSEEFWPENRVISFLKIRGSYGQTGNDNVGDFRYLSTVGGGRNYTIGDVLQNGVSPNAISNPDLRWEKTTQTNIGFDMNFVSGFNLTADVFTKETTGMLLDIAVPWYVGNNGPVGNIADMTNKGVELELGYRKTFGEFKLDLAANATYIKNKVTYLGADKEFLGGQVFSPQAVQITRTAVGLPVGYIYGYRTDGIFQNQSEINSYVNSEGKLLQPNARPGDLRFVDVNKDGSVSEDDRTFIGNPTPDWTFGFTASASYKNFDVVAFGQGTVGNDVFQALRRFDLPTANWTTAALGRWTGEGSTNSFPRLTIDDKNQNFSRSSDFFVEDGSYFRIKVLQVGYSLPSSMIHKIGLNKLRIYATANNLVTFTKYSGYDPEIGGGSYGVDRGYYPQARSFMLGVNVGF